MGFAPTAVSPLSKVSTVAFCGSVAGALTARSLLILKLILPQITLFDMLEIRKRPEREAKRFCYECVPARHELAGHAPRILPRMDLREEVLRAALAARRYVVDRAQKYPLAQRIDDLVGSIDGGIY